MSLRASRLGRIAAAGSLLACAAAPAARAQRVAEIQMAPPTLRMVPDAQTQVSATAYDSSGTPLNVRFRWSSSNVNIVVVDSTGTVRAVAPGAALIQAAPHVEQPRGSRRRIGQILVRVLPTMPPAPTSVGGTPAPPGGPGVPPGAMIPRQPVPGPAVIVSPRAVDSMIKASINCDEPMINATNPMRACYDERPRSRAPIAFNLGPCDERSGVMLLLRIDTAGVVEEVRPFAGTRCPVITDSLVALARVLSFQPARRAGQPVPAWLRIVVPSGPVPPSPFEPAAPPAPPKPVP